MLSVQCTLHIQAELSRFLEKEHPVLSEMTGNTILLQLAGKKQNPLTTLVNALRLSLCFLFALLTHQHSFSTYDNLND